MYLVTLVSATFVGRRPAGHLELVDLSVEKKTAEQRKQQQTRHGDADDRADLCMQPLFPTFLESPSSSSSSSDSSVVDSRERQTLPLETKQEQVDQVLPSEDADAVAMKTIKPSRARVAPKLGSLFSDAGGVSTRVQRHPLEMISEQERDGDSDSSSRASSTRNSSSAAPVLPHPLARVDESPVKVSSLKEIRHPVKEKLENERKQANVRKGQRASTAIPAPVRKVKPQPQRRAPMTRSDCPKPRSCPKPKVQPAAVTDPSLANPVMERMPQIASPEPAYAWSKKVPLNLPKLEVSNMDVIEDPGDQLRYASPKMSEWDAQDDLSFRVWERESNPKRKSISVSRDFQDSLDLEVDVAIDQPTAGRKVAEPECPSPSSFTCGLSSTSLFSDEEEEESSEEFNRKSFSTFTYSDTMGEVTSSSDDGAASPELRYFQEAGHREPWLELDDADLQFLLKDEEPVPEISTPAAAPSAIHVHRHSRSSSLSKPKRAVRFAPELVRKMSAPRTSIRLPPLPNVARDDDDQIYPSVKSWEVVDDEDTVTSTASTPRRISWRSPKPPRADPGAASRPRWGRPCGKCDPEQVRRRDQILPCAGRLFSWPQRLASRVSRSSSRCMEVSTDDERVVVAAPSFKGSARRDARIHQNNLAVASSLKVADLLDENFARS